MALTTTQPAEFAVEIIFACYLIILFLLHNHYSVIEADYQLEQ